MLIRFSALEVGSKFTPRELPATFATYTWEKVSEYGFTVRGTNESKPFAYTYDVRLDWIFTADEQTLVLS